MIAIGLSWILYWSLVDSFGIEALKATLITGIVFIAIGLLWLYKRFDKHPH
jgi:hypothetical protein